MGRGFLQGFYEDQILGEPSPDVVGRQGYRQALHLAMLGLADEAHAIFMLLHRHDLKPARQWAQGTSIALFYHASDLASPLAGEESDVVELQRFSMKFPLSYIHNSDGQQIDLDNITENDFSALHEYTMELTSKDHANAATGYAAVKLSAALTTLTYMADALGKEAEARDLLAMMSRRINANRQAAFIDSAFVAWEKWFLPGELRRAIGVEIFDLQDYTVFVRETLEKRLENGPVLPGEVYAGKSIRELLEELDRNTMSDPEFDPSEFWFGGEEEAQPASIFKEPATEEDIRTKEEEMGRWLPGQLRELLKISNGCEHVKSAPGDRAMRLVPLDMIFLEDDEYMDDYGFSLLPDFKVEPARPRGIDEKDYEYSFKVELCRYGGGIGIYEPDGQGTDYVWILPGATVDAARRKVQETYDKVSEEQQGRIEEEIGRRYGSRAVYEGIEYCINVQGWGSPKGQKVYPDFMSYLRAVVYESRVGVDRSPVKGGED